jgi:hypothetical protein
MGFELQIFSENESDYVSDLNGFPGGSGLAARMKKPSRISPGGLSPSSAGSATGWEVCVMLQLPLNSRSKGLATAYIFRGLWLLGI